MPTSQGATPLRLKCHVVSPVGALFSFGYYPMWQGIHGHDAVVEQFRQSLAANRLATTYLFVGPEGVGKRTFALKLAQALLCIANDDVSLEPCGQCESCRLAVAGNHPDVLRIERDESKFLKLEQFIGDREHRNQAGLCHDISLRPMLGRRRVAIIDDADWFTPESANCLLKTLEEPPPGAVIILVGTSRSRQLSTILSRSQVVRFSPLPAEAIRDLSLSGGLVADTAAAAELAARSGGSMAAARELADVELWQMRDRFAAQWTSSQLDVPRLMREVEDFAGAAGKEAAARRERLRQLFWLVGDILRHSLRTSATTGESNEGVLAALDRCLEAEEQLDRNANQSTLIECWLNDLAEVHEAQSAGGIA